MRPLKATCERRDVGIFSNLRHWSVFYNQITNRRGTPRDDIYSINCKHYIDITYPERQRETQRSLSKNALINVTPPPQLSTHRHPPNFYLKDSEILVCSGRG